MTLLRGLFGLCVLLFSGISFSNVVLARSSLKTETCGYQSCPVGKEGFINVHLLAHTHDDVGWLKTVDQYYYGARNNIQQAGVQYILDSVVEELKDHPDRRFIYVEVAFFLKWWNEQNEEMRNLVRDLVSSGRLEFINGGWCMNDEATTHYVDIIDQMSLGLNVLNDTFGECGRPRIAWQIDPFGHSREQANLFAQMGFDGMFFGRLDHEDKAQRMASKTMEMIWSASNNLGADGSLFTGIHYNTYFSPSGFCFDILCSDQPIIDDPDSKEYNVNQRIKAFLDYCQQQANAYATDNILVTMGSDFTYQDANVWFSNMDKLIKYANALQVTEGSKFNLFYSTPSCYVKSLNDLGRQWPSKNDDFFPYGSDAHAYWTGYFTSRPASKYMIRQGSNLLQSCKQMSSVLSLKGANNGGDVSVMKEAMGIMQHHDAATGTEKQHVADDYARLLHIGVEECRNTQTSYYKSELALGGVELPPVSYCQLNMSQCELSETNSRFVVNVYNSLTRFVDKYVRVPLASGAIAYTVLDPQGQPIPSQRVPIADYVKNLPGRTSTATSELVFLASQIPPLGSQSYYVQPAVRNGRKARSCKPVKLAANTARADQIVSNGMISLKFDGTTNLLKSITVDGKETRVSQEFMWYAGMSGDNASPNRRASGAYIFRNDGIANTIPTNGVEVTLYQGELVQEVQQKYNDWVGQTIRLYRGQDHVELDWVVGPIPVEDGVGKEIISRVSSDLASENTFYTDANSRQSVRRVIDTRDSYTYTVTEPVSANYYPVNAHIFLKDNSQQLSLIVDRSQGGASLKDGQLELMVHRRLLHDDAFGVNEALNEMAYDKGLVVRGTHYLALTDSDASARTVRTLGRALYSQPQVSFIATAQTFDEWSANFRTQQQSIARALPQNVNLLSMENRADGTYLMRLEHTYDVDEDPELSQPVEISIEDLFSGFTVTNAEETMLGGNQFKKDSSRLPWATSGVGDYSSATTRDQPLTLSAITLQPMEIRTFVLTINRN